MQLVITQQLVSKKAIVLAGLSLLLIVLLLFSFTIGAVKITVPEIFHIIGARIGLAPAVDGDVQSLVLLNIRLPRLLFTTFIGAALGIAGASLQGLFRNPLVEPGIVGVSSGAAVGAIAIIMGGKFLGSAIIIGEGIGRWLLPLASFIGGTLATAVTLRLGKVNGKTNIIILVLVGVAITSLAGAIIGLCIFYADEQQLRSYTFWTLGDLGGATWEKTIILAPLTILPTIILLSLTRPLNAIALGEVEAFHSGVNVERVKLMVILLCAMAVGTSVAFAGMIGFVGLVVPHIIRISFSPDHEIVLPASALGGACLLLIADMISRTVVAPAELPVGIVTAVIGSPFFLYLLIAAKKKKMFL